MPNYSDGGGSEHDLGVAATALPDPVLEAFWAQVLSSPDRLAVRDDAGETTYSGLDTWSEQVASKLRAAGLGPGQTVTVWGARTASLIVAMLAIRKTGAATCILDPALPIRRSAAAVAAVTPKACLRCESAGTLPEPVLAAHDAAGCRVVVDIPTCSPHLNAALANPTTAPVCVRGDDLDYILFTSGTTGTPKAVATPRKCLAHFLLWYRSAFSVGPMDRFTLLSGLGHDPLMRDIFVPLVIGASLGVPRADALKDPADLIRWFQDWKPTVSHMTPTLAAMIASAVESGVAAPVPSWRFVLLGGEALSYADVGRLRFLAPNAEFINCYGATETPQIAACFRIGGEARSARGRVPVGVGIADTQTVVVDAEGKPVQPGEIGEICVCTPYLALGYLNDSELTASRFIVASFGQSNASSSRAYCTGDLGTWDEKGIVTCLGRKDHQLKIRGFRVELEEVEAVLESLAGVRKAAVVVRERSPRDRQLVAWIEAAGIREDSLRDALKTLLPSHMMPARIVQLERFPCNASGKIDRRALTEESFRLELHTASGSMAETTTEQILAGIWEQILGLSPIGREDNFFDLGGDSVLTVELLISLQRAFSIELSTSEILAHPTLSSLALTIVARANSDVASKRCDLVRNQVEVVKLASGGQKKPLYWIPGGGGLSVVAFRQISVLLDAHRTVYGLVNSVQAAQRSVDLRERAAQYVEAILRAQPDGPYHLLGYSYGSWMAFEMAKQMCAAGRSVGLLAVFDTEVARELSVLEWAQALWQMCVCHCARLVELPPEERRGYIQTNIKPSYWNLRRRVRQFRDGKLGLGDLFDAADRLNRQATRAYLRSGDIGIYPGRILAVLAKTSPWSVLSATLDPRARWSKLAAVDCDLRYVPGSHLSMIEPPYAEHLAVALQEFLRAQP